LFKNHFNFFGVIAMDEMTAGQQKPLRRTSNKIKDIYDTYLKNQSSRNIPISDLEQDKNQSDNTDDDKNSPLNEKGSNDNNEKLEDDNFIKATDVEEAFNLLNEQINSISKERDDLKDQLMRKAAEVENIRRRSIKEKQDMIDYANERLLYNLIELLDDINSAADAAKKTTDSEAISKGLDMISAKAKKLFEDAGVKRMDDTLGSQFDVHFHEALMAMNSPHPDGTVVQVIQPGYMINEKVLRHAKVITSNGQSA
jgi:molecular chaperone GrpE